MRQMARIVRILEVANKLFSSVAVKGATAIFMLISDVRSCLEVMEKDGLVVSAVKNGKQVYYPSRSDNREIIC